MARHPYIAIEGVIGVGKTTLARLLQPELNGELVLEVFEENPFLSDFYADRDRYAFQTQIFFLLSRYRQQLTNLPSGLLRGPVIADYTFEKDRLFAHLNLRGDERTMYDRVYAALGEQLRQPDLMIYLKADLEVLMARIAQRDRPYERNMQSDYIEELRIAYDDFMSHYEGALLTIDTNNLNIVHNQDDCAAVLERIKSTLEYGTYQKKLPGVNGVDDRKPQEVLEDLESGARRLIDYQHFHISLDAEKGFETDPYFNFISFSEEIGELARVLRRLWIKQIGLQREGLQPVEAQQQAVDTYRERIKDELADTLAYLLKLSNYAGIDLEEAYLEKMDINTRRLWKDGKIVEEAEE